MIDVKPPQPATLAPCQENQWELMCALAPDPGRALYVVVENRFLEGRLDRAALTAAFADVIRRHDGLRLALDSLEPDPRVRIDERIEPPVDWLDLSGLDEARQQEAIEELSFHENQRCFDLRRGPAWHAWVVRLGPERHLLNACFCHLVADGWAPRVFVIDLLAFYGARLGLCPPPAGDALTFAEMHALQSRRMEAGEGRLRFWREHLLPLAPPKVPRLLRARPDADLMARARVEFRFPPGIVKELRREAWRSRTTTLVAMMAAYHVLLCLASGRDRSVINTAMLGRNTRREKEAILQFAIDPYVGTRVPEAALLREVVRAAADALTGAIEHALPFGALARAVNPDFDRQRPWPAHHLCDGVFIDTAVFEPHMSLAGLEVTQVFLPGRPAPNHVPGPVASRMADPAALAWEIRSGPGMLIYPFRGGGSLRYNSEVHSDEEMQEWVRRYLWVVEAVTRRPETRVGELREQHARLFGG